MSELLATGTISKDFTKSDQDWIFDGVALPNATTLSSSEFLLGKTQGAVGLRVEAKTAISIADGETLTFNLRHALTAGGDYTTVQLKQDAPSGDTADYTAGEFILEYVPGSDIGPFCILDVVTSASEVSETFDAYLRYISR